MHILTGRWRHGQSVGAAGIRAAHTQSHTAVVQQAGGRRCQRIVGQSCDAKRANGCHTARPGDECARRCAHNQPSCEHDEWPYQESRQRPAER